MKLNKSWYDQFGRALEIKCVESVKKELKSSIPLSASDILRVIRILKVYDRDEVRKYFDELKVYWKTIKKFQVNYDMMMVYMSPRLRWVAISAIETCGTDKLDFELKKLIINWYGIERARMQVFKEFIPLDDREGMHDDKYDGTTREQFTLDHIALTGKEETQLDLDNNIYDEYDYDPQAMESAVENNSFKFAY